MPTENKGEIMHQELEEYLSSFYLLFLKFGYKGKKSENPTVLNALKNPYWESKNYHIWQDEPSKAIFKAIHSDKKEFLSLDEYESDTIRSLMYSGVNEKLLNNLYYLLWKINVFFKTNETKSFLDGGYKEILVKKHYLKYYKSKDCTLCTIYTLFGNKLTFFVKGEFKGNISIVYGKVYTSEYNGEKQLKVSKPLIEDLE